MPLEDQAWGLCWYGGCGLFGEEVLGMCESETVEGILYRCGMTSG